MATLTIRNVDPQVHALLRQRAARHGRSMEAEVRALLDETVRRGAVPAGTVARAIRDRFADLETGSALDQPPRDPLPPPSHP